MKEQFVTHNVVQKFAFFLIFVCHEFVNFEFHPREKKAKFQKIKKKMKLGRAHIFKIEGC